MAFRMSQVGATGTRYGTGETSFTPRGTGNIINTYAKVEMDSDNTPMINGKTLTFGTPRFAENDTEAFPIGSYVLIHVSGYNGTADYCKHIGNWLISRVTAKSGDTITLYRSAADLKGKGHLVQIVSIPEYGTVTLNSGVTITCPQFNISKGYGGIVVFKCSEELIFNGGHIDLAGKGLPDTSIRPLLNQEKQYLPQQSYSGYENYMTKSYFTLNYPDGAAMIYAQKTTCHEDSRIGNTALAGVARHRGYELPNVTGSRIFGGSSIMLVSEEIEDFTPSLIAKYSSVANQTTGGLCRAYIATESTLPCDEGLYALDRIADKYRISSELNIKSYGTGELAATTTYVKSCWNSYALVDEVFVNKKSKKVEKVRIGDVTKGLAGFKAGALIMLHATQKKYRKNAGSFWITEIDSYDASTAQIVLKDAWQLPFTFSNYYVQVIAIPQFENFTLAKSYAKTPAFDVEKGGGICAIACSGTLDLSGGKILVTNPNSQVPVLGEGGLNYISNAGMATKLPLGSGHGSIFILAKNIIMNEDTRLGAAYSGAGFGGGSYQRGYGSVEDNDKNGSGLQAGVNDDSQLTGGYGSNAAGTFSLANGGKQGAHLFIVANSITGLNLAALSTGGEGGSDKTLNVSATSTVGGSGGCGYGGEGVSLSYNNKNYYAGDGGFHGGGAGSKVQGRDTYAQGGGAGGFCFIYANSAPSINTDLLTIA